MIHETAIIDSGASLGEGVSIGPYAIVEKGVILGDGCELQAHAVVKHGSELGPECFVGHSSVIGGDPQMSGFDRSLETGVRIGERVSIRENVTVHRSAFEGKHTLVGENALLMVGCHVGHDCEIGSDVTIANAALLAGHVVLGDHVFVGGGAAFHQFVRVGESAMIGGLAAISLDVPPFLTVAERNMACGPNLVGLRRRGFSGEALTEIKFLYKVLFMEGGNPRALAAKIHHTPECPKTPEGLRFLEFFAEGERGFVRSRSRVKDKD
ncbi:MAG: acyl-[acyl-carrier-protein]--UDP-N-acetylglucosamine O-acyltransferase [Opitutae bacterium]|nr:acyl-[acyl-carrier-protein]--UDP-N-acetylglucosamine O-acyltransferase [Opitutae bacterium]|tara:strand:- start:1799 stop:2599 length:801 start_codon:yes stop_codon:yes gene_type:complete